MKITKEGSCKKKSVNRDLRTVGFDRSQSRDIGESESRA